MISYHKKILNRPLCDRQIAEVINDSFDECAREDACGYTNIHRKFLSFYGTFHRAPKSMTLFRLHQYYRKRALATRNVCARAACLMGIHFSILAAKERSENSGAIYSDAAEPSKISDRGYDAAWSLIQTEAALDLIPLAERHGVIDK